MGHRGTLSQLKALVLAEVSGLQGFMQLLMKPRNGEPWSPEDRAELKRYLAGLARTIPILGVFALPGSTLLLPLVALWLDRRRRRRSAGTAATSRTDVTP